MAIDLFFSFQSFVTINAAQNFTVIARCWIPYVMNINVSKIASVFKFFYTFIVSENAIKI